MPLAPAQTEVARSYRHAICTLAYVRIDHANGGIIRNLSDDGMGIQAVGRLHPDQVVHLRFEFIRPRAKFELIGQVAWADAAGQAGLRFTDVPPRTRRLLKDWMLTDLLTATLELAQRGPVLENVDAEHALVVSKSPFHPIRLVDSERCPDAVTQDVCEEEPILLPWLPFALGQRSFAGLVDSTTVLSAVLLFSIIVAELTDAVPTWRMLLWMESILIVMFALLYRYLCHLTIRRTLGSRLATLASQPIPEKPVSSAWDPY